MNYQLPGAFLAGMLFVIVLFALAYWHRTKQIDTAKQEEHNGPPDIDGPFDNMEMIMFDIYTPPQGGTDGNIPTLH